MTYKIGICEDEDIFRNELIEMLKIILRKNGIQAEIITFSALERLKNYLADPLENPLDLILLDIYFNEDETGMDFAKKFRQINETIEIIFVTSTKEFALEGYTIESKAYLVKPVDPILLEEAILRTFNKHISKKVVLATPSKTLTLDINRILYIEIIDKLLMIHFSDGSIEKIKLPLNQVRDKLPTNQFFQTHRSFIVSLPAVKKVKKYKVILSNNEDIPVSRQNYNLFQEALMDWNVSN